MVRQHAQSTCRAGPHGAADLVKMDVHGMGFGEGHDDGVPDEDANLAPHSPRLQGGSNTRSLSAPVSVHYLQNVGIASETLPWGEDASGSQSDEAPQATLQRSGATLPWIGRPSPGAARRPLPKGEEIS